MSTLYDIVSQANTLEEWIAEAGGELTPEIEDLLKGIDMQERDKIDGYDVVLDRLEMNAEHWQERANRLSSIARGLKSLRGRIRDRIKEVMLATGRTEVKGNEIRFKLQRVAPGLFVDEATLSPSYFDIVTTKSVARDRIKSALKDGIEVQGARLEEATALRVYPNKGEE